MRQAPHETAAKRQIAYTNSHQFRRKNTPDTTQIAQVLKHPIFSFEDMGGGKSENKAVYFDKLKGLLEEYNSVFVVTVDNVS